VCSFPYPLPGPRVTYVPPPLAEDEATIFSHYESGINFNKYDDILVDVSGVNPPKAIFVSVVESNCLFCPLDGAGAFVCLTSHFAPIK